MIRKIFCCAFFALLTTPSLYAQSSTKTAETKIINIMGRYPSLFAPYKDQSEYKVRLLKVNISEINKTVNFYFNSWLAQIPVSQNDVDQWKRYLRFNVLSKLPIEYTDYNIALYTKDFEIEHYIPNLLRTTNEKDYSRYSTPSSVTPLLTQQNKNFEEGLSGRHIALWASHGYIYETRADKPRWEFQRPAMFSTIEDLNTVQYVNCYLSKMLENAGAVVVMPRERSFQREEIVVDNDSIIRGCNIETTAGVWYKVSGGYRHVDTLRNENPQTMGSYLLAHKGAEVTYSAMLPTKGKYGVTISYKSLAQSSDKVKVTVVHSGGESTIDVNQQIGGSMWIYLGEWEFDGTAKVKIEGVNEGVVTADAVRFGGGMGSVTRGGNVSGMPRWAEAARYYLQYSGIDSTIYRIGEIESKEDPKRKKDTPDKLDYIDDYKCRSEWVNYMIEEKGVPIDMSLGVHSNAGIVDTLFGTLSIHYTEKGKGKLGDGSSKFSSRDLAQLVQNQVVMNLRERVDKDWTMRSMFDREYAEVSRPIVPSMILEMFSHQNENDMKYGTSPRFRFEMARAIYIGILKYLSDRYHESYSVQPLPVFDFKMEMSGNDAIRLSWRDNIDRLEKSAMPTHYRLYTRIGDGGFDDGTVVSDGSIVIPIERDGKMRSYMVTAVNEGGESFLSEVLSCGFSGTGEVEIVKNSCRKFSSSVPYVHDWGYVGEVYDRERASGFVDNENPGYGASRKDFAGIGREGEGLDNTVEGGRLILENGGNYISEGSGMNHWIEW